MRPEKLRHLLLPVILVVAVGCGSGGPGGLIMGGGGADIPPPNPDGVLLDGDPGGRAVDATRILPPSPVEEFDIIDGLLTTRLDATISPTTTVGEVNDLMIRHGVRIVCMMTRDMFVTLKIPAVMNETEASAMADSLTAGGVFLTAYPARQIMPSQGADRTGSIQRILPPTGVASIGHLTAIHMPAAWNSRRLARTNNKKMTVLVPDSYYSDETHGEIGVMRFAQYGGLVNDAVSNSGTWYPGNHGFHVAGIVGANFDDTSITGTSPDPQHLLDVAAVLIGGLTWNDMFAAIVLNFPANGNFVISTSLGYPNDRGIRAADKYWRAVAALNWRRKTAPSVNRFVHATAAGNEANDFPANDAGDARYGSPWTVASSFDDLRESIPLDSIATADSTRFERLWESVTAMVPEAGGPMVNTLVVGSSNAQGVRTSFSNRNADVRVVGENVPGPCAAADPAGGPGACDGNTAIYSGTSQATPQIAGLSAYLWNLKPGMSSGVVVDAITANYENGLVNAFSAVMSLDESIAGAKVRNALVDVAGATVNDPANGIFDPVDIEKILSEFDTRSGALDWSRYDLNGDGHTGGGTTSEIDLNADGTIGTVEQFIETASRNFNESAVSDLDMLCYYAWGPFFSGSTTRRRELLGTCIPDPCPNILLIANTNIGTYSNECEGEKFLTTPDYPANVLQELECDVLGTSWSFSSSCSTSYTEGSIQCESFVTLTPNEPRQAIAFGTIDIVDTLTVINPGLAGTEGTLMVAVQLGAERLRTSSYSSTLFSTVMYFQTRGGTFQTGFQDQWGDGIVVPDQIITIPITFVYGQPMFVNFRFDAQARIFNLAPRNTHSRIRATYSWLWIDGAAAGSSYSWCSGLSFGNITTPQATAQQ